MRTIAWTLIALVGATACKSKKEEAPAAPTAEVKAPAAAEQKKEPAGKVDPEFSPEYRANLALVHMSFRAYGRAADELEKAVAEAKDGEQRSNLYMRLGEALEAGGRETEAGQAYQKAADLATNPETQTGLLLKLGRRRRAAEQLPEAEQAFLQVFETSKHAAERRMARQELLQIWRKRNSLEGKIAEYEEALKADPKDQEALLMLGEAYWRFMNEPKKAVEYYERLHGLDTKDRETMLALGDVYISAQQYGDAIGIFEKMTKLYPDDKPHLYGRIADSYSLKGDKAEAIKWGKKMVELSPQQSYMRVRLAQIYELNGMPRDAIGEYTKAIELATNPTEKETLRFQLAQAYLSAGQPQDASPILEEIARAPSGEGAGERARKMLDLVKAAPPAGNP